MTPLQTYYLTQCYIHNRLHNGKNGEMTPQKIQNLSQDQFHLLRSIMYYRNSRFIPILLSLIHQNPNHEVPPEHPSSDLKKSQAPMIPPPSQEKDKRQIALYYGYKAARCGVKICKSTSVVSAVAIASLSFAKEMAEGLETYTGKKIFVTPTIATILTVSFIADPVGTTVSLGLQYATEKATTKALDKYEVESGLLRDVIHLTTSTIVEQGIKTKTFKEEVKKSVDTVNTYVTPAVVETKNAISTATSNLTQNCKLPAIPQSMIKYSQPIIDGTKNIATNIATSTKTIAGSFSSGLIQSFHLGHPKITAFVNTSVKPFLEEQWNMPASERIKISYHQFISPSAGSTIIDRDFCWQWKQDQWQFHTILFGCGAATRLGEEFVYQFYPNLREKFSAKPKKDSNER